MLSDLFFSLRDCSISDLLRNPPIYRIKNLRKRQEILSPLYRIAIMRNIQIFNTFVIKSPVLWVSDQRVKITYFRATHCHIPCIREYTPPPPNPFHVTQGATQGATQSLPTVFPVKWIYITMQLQLNWP